MQQGLSKLRAATTTTPVDIHVQEGGAPYRFLLALAASSPGKIVRIHPGERLARRPIAPLINALRGIGASISSLSDSGFYIEGKLLRGTPVVDGSLSSQFATALMLASPLWADGAWFLTRTGNETSASYLTMTECMLRQFILQPAMFSIEADWSAASFFYEVILVAKNRCVLPELTFPGLEAPSLSLQGDAGIVSLTEKALKIISRAKGNKCSCFEADMSNTPDLIPPLCVGCTLAGIPYRISGARTLRHKESDRIEALMAGLNELGYAIRVQNKSDGDLTLHYDGEPSTRKPADGPCYISACNDHRIAMAFAVARMAGYEVVIDHPQVVSKSFPDFFSQLSKIICIS